MRADVLLTHFFSQNVQPAPCQHLWMRENAEKKKKIHVNGNHSRSDDELPTTNNFFAIALRFFFDERVLTAKICGRSSSCRP